jgi:hypothetical protein
MTIIAKLKAEHARKERVVMTIAAAKRVAGLVSIGNTKMPGSTFAVSATKCGVGGKLQTLNGSVCNKCYALRLEKMRPSVHQGWLANYEKSKLVETNAEAWAEACAFLINKAYEKTGEAYHRWFDSGDLPSLSMLMAIIMVCNKTPHIKHWLPTREAKIVKAYEAGEFPPNLVVRLSSPMVGDKPMRGYANTSTVHRKGEAHVGHECPAYKQDNQCGSCRACWSKGVANVSYKLH